MSAAVARVGDSSMTASTPIVHSNPDLKNKSSSSSNGSKIKNASRSGPTFKVIIIGDPNVGKTCLSFRFCNDRFPAKTEATIGVDFRERSIDIDGELIKVQLWDTAGQERLRQSMVSHYYRNVHAVVFVYDLTKPQTFHNLVKWIQECSQHNIVPQLQYNDSETTAATTTRRTPAEVPMILVGNKCDMSDVVRVSTHEAQKFADQHNMPFFETSAMMDSEADQVESIFMTLVHKLKESKSMHVQTEEERQHYKLLAEAGTSDSSLTESEESDSGEEIETVDDSVMSVVEDSFMEDQQQSQQQQGNGGGQAGEMEEINTKDLAERISTELKRCNIPQAIFAQRVLCRSQGTLSDLLSHPKPWSKLKSGRETFRRMFKWLQEPEFQRMSALGLPALPNVVSQATNFDQKQFEIDRLPESNKRSIWPPTISQSNNEVPKLVTARRDDRNKMLHVAWENGAKAKYAYVWLRDNCPAPHTYQLTEMCKARNTVMAELDVDVEPISIENRGDHLRIEWPQGKTATYESKWLALRNLDDARLRARRRQVMLHDEKILWGRKEIEDRIRWYDFDRLMTDDRSTHEALMELIRLGILFIDAAPAKVGQLRRLADRVGFEYMSRYGKIFTVKSDANPSTVAYTSDGLELHTALPYLQYPPQLQSLHCIEQVKTKGGENQFSDAFYVAEQIRRREPEAFRILCSVPLEYVDDGRDHIQFDLTYKWPVLSYNRDGRLEAVHFSNQQRSSFYDVPVEELHSVYKALKTFDDYIRTPSNMLELKLKPGQMVLFDNLRVLHGRSTFQMTTESGGRHMEGCYFNWDYVKSKIRIVRDRLNLEPNQMSV